jgi:hypothetical protein
MKTLFSSCALAAFLSFAAPVFAQDYIILDQRADEFDRYQDRLDYQYGNPVISREFDVPVTVLEEQRTRTSLGYGGLMIANALARETGRPFDEIVAMKQSGMGWGRIAQDNGVKLGPAREPVRPGEHRVSQPWQPQARRDEGGEVCEWS